MVEQYTISPRHDKLTNGRTVYNTSNKLPMYRFVLEILKQCCNTKLANSTIK